MPLFGESRPNVKRDKLPLDAELILVEGGIDERHVRNAVGDQVDLGLRNVVNLPEKRARPLGHHDHPGRQIDDLVEHPALIVAGLLEHRVQGGGDRHPQIPQQADDVAAGRAAEDAVLMLQTDDVGVGEVQVVRRAQVTVKLLLLDLEPDFPRVVIPLGEIVHRHHEAVGTRKLGGHRRADVMRERGNPALARQIVADEGDFPDFSSPRHGCHKTL